MCLEYYFVLLYFIDIHIFALVYSPVIGFIQLYVFALSGPTSDDEAIKFQASTKCQTFESPGRRFLNKS